MKTDTYIVTLESGHYEWTREKEIKGMAAAKCIGAQKAKEQNKDIFYIIECTQWWPRELAEVIKNECETVVCDDDVMSNVSKAEFDELRQGVETLIRQWLIRNKRIPNGAYYGNETAYKVVNGKAVRVG
ncbi:hypothetical protein [uncultured Veillonella sp.]|uniref:hypothetical protein n=1 Tax=uncultured Veillonella sp. TaxID=159268 RepID=UPI00260EB898|nr:hypothetical protein [uncultured Veillonella sp.]